MVGTTPTRTVVRAAVLLAGIALCGCDLPSVRYAFIRARVTVATIDCTMPEDEGPGRAEAPAAGAEGLAEEGEAGTGPGTPAVELVPMAEETGEEAGQEDVEKGLDPRMDRHLARIARLVARTKADVVALQGLSGTEALDRLLVHLKEAGWRKKFSGYAFFDGEGRRPGGIAVLSRRPLVSFDWPEVEPGSALEHSECVRARVELPWGQDLVLFSFRLHEDATIQMEEAQALYDLTLPLRNPDVNLMLLGCLSCPAPYEHAPPEEFRVPAAALAGTNTPSRGDDLTDLHAYLWPRQRSSGPEGESSRILVSPELVADTWHRADWFLKGVEVLAAEENEGEGPRALVARFALR